VAKKRRRKPKLTSGAKIMPHCPKCPSDNLSVMWHRESKEIYYRCNVCKIFLQVKDMKLCEVSNGVTEAILAKEEIQHQQ